MTEEERGAYILNWVRTGITVEQQIREVLPLVAGELGNGYAREAHIRASRYTHDVRWLLAEIDRLRRDSARLDWLEGQLEEWRYHADFAIQSDEDDGVWFARITRHDCGVLKGTTYDGDDSKSETVRAAIDAAMGQQLALAQEHASVLPGPSRPRSDEGEGLPKEDFFMIENPLCTERAEQAMRYGRKNFEAALGFQDRAMRAEAERDQLRAQVAAHQQWLEQDSQCAENQRLRAELEKARTAWRCFHCGFEANDKAEAEAHFGDVDDPSEFLPACTWWARLSQEERLREFQDLRLELHSEREGSFAEVEQLRAEHKRLYDAVTELKGARRLQTYALSRQSSLALGDASDWNIDECADRVCAAEEALAAVLADQARDKAGL